jgi:hypothetical protein
MIEAFLYSFFPTFFLLIWFKTNFIVEYFYMLPWISKYINNYKKSQSAGIGGNFINFLALNYNSFFVRLISCPFCINFWITLTLSLLTNILYFGLIYTTSLIYYYIVVTLSSYESN